MARPSLTVEQIAERDGLATKSVAKDKGMLANSRHEAFAHALARGSSADDAYVEAGYNRNRGNATRLKANQDVSRRVDELKALVQKMEKRSSHRVVLDREWIVEQLVEVVFMAKSQEKPDLAGANKALHLLGLDIGMFVERKEVGKPGEFDGLTIASKRERVIAIAQTLGLDRIAPSPKPALVPATIEHEPTRELLPGEAEADAWIASLPDDNT